MTLLCASSSDIGKRCLTIISFKSISTLHVTVSSFGMQIVKITFFIEILFGVFDLSCKFLDWLSHSFLQSFLKEEQEYHEHEDVEDKKNYLENKKILVDEISQLVFDIKSHCCLLPTDDLHVVICIVELVVCYVIKRTSNLISIVFIPTNQDCVVESARIIVFCLVFPDCDDSIFYLRPTFPMHNTGISLVPNKISRVSLKNCYEGDLIWFFKNTGGNNFFVILLLYLNPDNSPRCCFSGISNRSEIRH